MAFHVRRVALHLGDELHVLCRIWQWLIATPAALVNNASMQQLFSIFMAASTIAMSSLKAGLTHRRAWPKLSTVRTTSEELSQTRRWQRPCENMRSAKQRQRQSRLAGSSRGQAGVHGLMCMVHLRTWLGRGQGRERP